jgi:hypothetical protein
MSIFAIVLVSLAGLYAVCTLGTSGGPNHGEHPLIITIIHLVAFIFGAKGWPSPLMWTYMGVLGAALLLAFFSVGFRGGWKDKPVLLARLGMASLYGGMLAILVLGQR